MPGGRHGRRCWRSLNDRATWTIADTAIVGWPAGRDYYGTLWRTDDGSDTPFWEGPVILKKVAAQV